MPQPLPPTTQESLNSSSHISLAYSKILRLEKALDTSHSKREVREKKLIHARILGYLIQEGPSTQAKEYVAEEVNSCPNDDKLDELGEMYYAHYIRVFRKNKDATPAPSTHPSRPSFEYKKDMIMAMLCEPSRSYGDAKRNALVRDGFRCVVTGRYDSQYVDKNLELEREAAEIGAQTAGTQCAHIFPASTNKDIFGRKEGGAKHEHAGSLWAILKCFGYEGLPERLNGDGIHSLDNVMTLDPTIHDWFDRLEIWFEAVDGMENTYAIRAKRDHRLRSCKANPITLQTETDISLPNPDYLRIHAACCGVAHLSGAAEHMDKNLEDLDDMCALSKDGSSAHALSFALQPFRQEFWVRDVASD